MLLPSFSFCLCVLTCIFACMCSYTLIYLCECVYVCIHVCIACIHVHKCMYMCIHVGTMFMCAYICTYVCASNFVCKFVNTYVYKHMCIYVHMRPEVSLMGHVLPELSTLYLLQNLIYFMCICAGVNLCASGTYRCLLRPECIRFFW